MWEQETLFSILKDWESEWQDMPEFVMPKHHLDFDFGFRSDCLDYKKNYDSKGDKPC